MANKRGRVQNLIANSDRTPEERVALARKAGKASGEARRKKKSMQLFAKELVGISLPNGPIRDSLHRFGVEDEDMNYQSAMIVRQLQKAIQDGDAQAARFMAELLGEYSGTSTLNDEENEYVYPKVMIPSNGRDKTEGGVITPQAGPQTAFMTSDADIIIYGGAAGGGKTYALLMEILRHMNIDGFGAVIFRKNYTQVTSQGGLWDTSCQIFSQVEGAESGKSPKLHWTFNKAAKLTFAHLGDDKELQSWQGSQIAYIGFDELTHFTKHQFLYMLSRNRSTCGIKPYVRATCNPDSESWVADFISWWIDQETGYPIKERSGIKRYLTVLNDTFYWADNAEDLVEAHGINKDDCKSVTFIASNLSDNQILMAADPSYLSNLKAMSEVDKERLLYGNWKIKKATGDLFMRSKLNRILEEAPNNLVAVVRAWDLAATTSKENSDAAYTAGVLMGAYDDGMFVVLDVINQQLAARDVRDLILKTAAVDKAKYDFVKVRLPQDPGQAGKAQADSYVKMLAGYDVVIKPESGDKVTRAEPMSAQWQHGHFDMVVGEWNDVYLNQLEAFPQSKFKDMVDASSSAFGELVIYTENKVYKPYLDNAEALTTISDDVAREPLDCINIGISVNDGTDTMAIVATAIIADHAKAVVILSQRLDSSSDGKAIEGNFLQFTETVYKKYGKVNNVYVNRRDKFLYRCIKETINRNGISINIRTAIADTLANRIRLANTMFVQERLLLTEDCELLARALVTAVRTPNGNALTEESDASMLEAFDYTIERESGRFIAK